MNVIEAILFMMYREINRYMKLASYRKNYPKYQTGKKEGKKFLLEIWHIWSIFIQYYIMNLL